MDGKASKNEMGIELSYNDIILIKRKNVFRCDSEALYGGVLGTLKA
jgi:hypothetical protein